MEGNIQIENKSKIKAIVEYCRKGNIWGVRDILSNLPESDYASLLNQYDQYGDTALVAASSNGHITLTEYLLSISGIDPNKGAEKTQFTPLMLAAAKGNKRIVELLLEMPTINIGVRSINQMTADDEAVYANHSDIAEMIRAKIK